MSSHQSAKSMTDTWLTPPYILEELGPFDLDPCSPVERPWPTAKKHLTIVDDGLSSDWIGRVWLNPPYGRETGKWMRKMAEHNYGTALIFARTETHVWFDYVWPKASAVCFIKGRLWFHKVDGSKGRSSGGAPSSLIAYGAYDAHRLFLFAERNGHKYIALGEL